MTIVYTDGACSGNPGPGGWAWAIPNGAFACGPEKHTTNQRMEVRAVLEALSAIQGEVQVVSDSTYVVNCFRDKWWKGWLSRGWVNSKKQPVANRDLWEPLIDIYQQRQDEVRFSWVKGHSNDPMNDVVDALAVQAGNQQRARSGEDSSSEASSLLKPKTKRADKASAPASTQAHSDVERPDPPTASQSKRVTKSPTRVSKRPNLPAGYKLLIAGHRPPELGGYKDNPIAQRVQQQIAVLIEATRADHDDLMIVSGLGLGAEQLGAAAAIEIGVPLVAVLAYPSQESVWPAATQAAYERLLGQATFRVTMSAKMPPTRPDAARALAARDEFLAAHIDEAILVWDGKDPQVGRIAHNLGKQIGSSSLQIVHPG